MARPSALSWSVVVLVLLTWVARVVHLDADPYFSTWIQYIVDEGRWNEIARNYALFGRADGGQVGWLHLALSPAYQAVNYVLFRIFGVEFWSARLFSATSGGLIVLCVALSLRRHVSLPALALGVVILGFESNMLVESRLALPEVPSLLAMLAAFLLLTVAQKSWRNAFFAGMLAAVAVALKGTSLPIVPVLLLIVMLSPEGDSRKSRMKRAFGLVCGFAVLAAAGTALALFLGLFELKDFAAVGNRLLAFISVTNPRLIVWRFFESAQLEVRNLLLLGAWFCSWIWLHRNPKISAVTRELYLMSGLWAGWWLVLWAINDYSPGRYVVHFVVPATIHLMAGLSAGDRHSIARIVATFSRSSGYKRWGWAIWLVVPAAIVVSTLVAAFGKYADLDFFRVSSRIGLIVALAGLMAAGIWRGKPREGAIVGFLLLPVLATALWLGGRELGVLEEFWVHEGFAALVLWVALLFAIAVACVAFGDRSNDSNWNTTVFSVVIALLAVTLFAQASPPIFTPTYSIRDAAKDIGRRYETVPRIRTLNAASLFLGNSLRFREISRNETRYDLLVIFEHNLASTRFIQSSKAENLIRVQTYPISVHPRYVVEEQTIGPVSIAVYRNM